MDSNDRERIDEAQKELQEMVKFYLFMLDNVFLIYILLKLEVYVQLDALEKLIKIWHIFGIQKHTKKTCSFFSSKNAANYNAFLLIFSVEHKNLISE